MKNAPFSLNRLAVVLVLLTTALACTEAPVPIDPAYAAEIEEWRSNRLQRLTAEDGWLSLTGLYWLVPGENRFGSASDSSVVLPDPNVPEIAGLLILLPDGTVAAQAEEGSGVEINGAEMTEPAVLATDADGRPDVITAGRIQFHIIKRGDKIGARVKDPEAPTRLAFEGISHFPVDPAMKVEARFEKYDAPRKVAIPTVLDQDTTMNAFGLLHFSIGGKELTLEPYMGSPDAESMFLIFRDGTSGVSTYGAGRFMSAEAAGEDGKTVLDFNYAYNPPCAFTPYATCPLPPPQNVMLVPIEAGEMYTGEAH